MKNLKNGAVIYTRTASSDQNHTSNSIQTQIDSCLNYAKNNDLEVQKIITDIGVSGLHTKSRSSIKELLSYVQRNKNIGTILVYKFDRLSRSPEEGLVAEAYLSRIGVKLTSVSDNLETTPTEKFIRVIMMAGAELDNDIKGQRVKDCMKAGFEAGNWMWKAPFGYIRKPDKSIKIDKDNYWLIKRIFAEAGRGTSSLEIAGLVNDSFYVSDVKLSADSIEKIVKNPFYKGFMKSSFSSDLVKGNFKPIVTLKQWERANSKL